MAHPSNDGGFGPLLDRNSFRSGDGATSDRRCMIGHNTSETLRKIGVVGVKAKKRHDGPGEVFNVNLLGLLPSLGIGFFAFGKALGGSLGFEFDLNPLNGRCRCPHAP